MFATRPQWPLVPQADNCSSSVVGLSGVLLSCRAACPAIRCLSTAALKTQDAAALPTHRSCALALKPLRLLSRSALKLSRTWPPSCSALVLWHSISSPARPLWRMASLSLSHSVDGHKPLRQQASALCHAQCFKSYPRLQLQLRPLRRPLWSSHACSLCHSQLSTARLLGRSALFGAPPLQCSAARCLQMKMPGARPLPVCYSGARLLVWSVHSSWHSCPRR